MEQYDLKSHSSSWLFFVKFTFAVSLIALSVGIVLLVNDILVKAYLGMAALFVVSATITLAKTLRDQHESLRLVNRISEAKTSRILNEFTD